MKIKFLLLKEEFASELLYETEKDIAYVNIITNCKMIKIKDIWHKIEYFNINLDDDELYIFLKKDSK